MTRPSIVVLGAMTRYPVAGIVWLTMQYVLGFERRTNPDAANWYMQSRDTDPACLALFQDDAYARPLLEPRRGYADSNPYSVLIADDATVVTAVEGSDRAIVPRQFRPDGGSARCKDSSRPAPPSASCRCTPPSTTRSTSSAT